MVFRQPAASTDESSSKRARSSNDSVSNEPAPKLLDGAFVKMMSCDVAAGKRDAASANKYLQLNYGIRSANHCLGILTDSLARQNIDIPPLMLIVDTNDWGKTGGSSSRNDWLAAFALGQSGTYLGVILAYNLDGPDSDASDYEGSMDDRPSKERFYLKVVPLSGAAMNTAWNASSDRSIFDDGVKDALSRAIGDAYESELVSIDFAPAGDGEVHVSKYDREAGETLVTDSGVAVSFDMIIAKAMIIMAAKHRHLKQLKKACSREEGVPQNIMPLFQAVQSEHWQGDNDDEVGEGSEEDEEEDGVDEGEEEELEDDEI